MASDTSIRETREIESGSSQGWLDVAHKLSGAVGLVRIIEEERHNLSDNVREIYEEGVQRLLSLIRVCVQQQEQADAPTIAERPGTQTPPND